MFVHELIMVWPLMALNEATQKMVWTVLTIMQFILCTHNQVYLNLRIQERCTLLHLAAIARDSHHLETSKFAGSHDWCTRQSECLTLFVEKKQNCISASCQNGFTNISEAPATVQASCKKASPCQHSQILCYKPAEVLKRDWIHKSGLWSMYHTWIVISGVYRKNINGNDPCLGLHPCSSSHSPLSGRHFDVSLVEHKGRAYY